MATTVTWGDNVAAICIVIALLSIGSLLLFEINIRVRRSFVKNRPVDREPSNTADLLKSFLILLTYGKWIKWMRVSLLGIVALSVIVGGIALLLSH